MWARTVRVTADDELRAVAALDWAKSPACAGDDYLANLNACARAAFLEIGRSTSILASVLSAWARATGSVLPGVTLPERAAKLDEYLASVGDKVRVMVTVEKQIQLEGNYGTTTYGTTTLHIMRSSAGHKLTWNCSGEALGEGWQGVLTGTVKRQEIYRNEHSTQLTRCSGEKDATIEGSAFEVLPATKKRGPKKAKAAGPRNMQCVQCDRWCTAEGCPDHGKPCASCDTIGCCMLIPHGRKVWSPDAG
jgi:hypothetical protein